MNKIKATLLSLTAALCVGSLGCSTPDQPRDPVRIEQVKSVIIPLASGAARRALLKNPELAPYVAKLGESFTKLGETGTFDLETLSGLLDGALAAQDFGDPEDRQTAIDVKNALFAVYAIYYPDRLNADVSERQFLLDVVDVLGRAIAQAVNDLNP